MLKTVAALVVLLIVAVLGFAATRPNTFRVQRATSIKAPPEKIFPLINDLHRWTAWSPYEKKDPAMKRTHSGAADGKGAVYEWEGNKDIGNGRMEITETAPPSRVTIRLDFVKPFEAHNVVEFALEPRGDATHVTWTLHGPMPYVSKLMSVFFNMDRMVGTDFETGLANLKAVAET
jgi:uncharacterized protein YndB with AHSA1/START domain